MSDIRKREIYMLTQDLLKLTFAARVNRQDYIDNGDAGAADVRVAHKYATQAVNELWKLQGVD